MPRPRKGVTCTLIGDLVMFMMGAAFERATLGGLRVKTEQLGTVLGCALVGDANMRLRLAFVGTVLGDDCCD